MADDWINHLMAFQSESHLARQKACQTEHHLAPHLAPQIELMHELMDKLMDRKMAQ